MILVTYLTYTFVWLLIRVLRDKVTSRIFVDLTALAGLYFVTKFFIENTL